MLDDKKIKGDLMVGKAYLTSEISLQLLVYERPSDVSEPIE